MLSIVVLRVYVVALSSLVVIIAVVVVAAVKAIIVCTKLIQALFKTQSSVSPYKEK